MYYKFEVWHFVGESGEFMFTGEYQHTLDNKNRLIVPSKIRDEIGNQIVITRGLDGCLFGYQVDVWKELMKKLNSLPFTKKDARNFVRFMTSGATTLEFDKQGRVVIPSYLCEYANINKDIVIIGVLNRIEIWDKNKWESFMQANVDCLSDISSSLFDSSFEL